MIVVAVVVVVVVVAVVVLVVVVVTIMNTIAVVGLRAISRVTMCLSMMAEHRA